MNTKYSVDLGDDPNGVGFVLGALLEENFTSFPERARVAARMKPTAVYSVDTDEAVTQAWGPASVQLTPGLVGQPKVTVKATVDQITDVSQLKMRGGGLLPVGLLFSGRGMKILGQILTRKLVVEGLVTHPVTALRFIALVSIVP